MSVNELLLQLGQLVVIVGAIFGAAKMIALGPSERRNADASASKSFAEAAAEYAEQVRKMRSEMESMDAAFILRGAEIDDLKDKMHDLTEAVSARDAVIEQLRGDVLRLTHENEAKETEIAGLRHTVETLTSQLRAVKKNTDELKAKE